MNAEPPPARQVALVEEWAARRGLEVGLVMSDHPLSFVWGYRRTKLVLSSGLLSALTPEELAVVILGGIVTPTFLNMIVIPALYLKFGLAEERQPSREIPRERGLAPAGD